MKNDCSSGVHKRRGCGVNYLYRTCCEVVCCTSKQLKSVHIQQAVVTVHHYPQHTLGQGGQGSDVVRQSLCVISNQLKGGLCSTLTVQCISDPCH